MVWTNFVLILRQKKNRNRAKVYRVLCFEYIMFTGGMSKLKITIKVLQNIQILCHTGLGCFKITKGSSLW